MSEPENANPLRQVIGRLGPLLGLAAIWFAGIGAVRSKLKQPPHGRRRR